MMIRSYLLCAGIVGVIVFGGLATVHAQGKPKAGAAAAPTSATSPPSGPPNALQGFSQNRDKPIQIDAARLEVRDKDKVATFFGDAKADVKVIQGDTTMRSKVLVVFYEQDDKSGRCGDQHAAPGGRASYLETCSDDREPPRAPYALTQQRGDRHLHWADSPDPTQRLA